MLLTSCENFLKANQVKNEIEESIEIANSSPILYHIIADKDSGTVSPSQVTLKKKGTVNLLFTPADGWSFICWEALDRTTGEPVPDAIQFENPQKLETKATIIKPTENLMIHPKCTLLPMVSSIVPAYDAIGCYQDSTITISFNKPVEPVTFGDFSCISIVDETGKSLFSTTPEDSYFQIPQFDQSDTQLNIRTKKEKFILDVNGEKQRSDITVTINFTNIKDKEGLNINQNAPYTYRISKDVERIPPEVKSLLLYKRGFAIQEETITEITDPDYPVRYYVKDTDDYTELSSCDFLAIENDKNNAFFTQNHVGKKIYFDADVLDQNSGYKQLTIKETIIRTVDALPVSQEVKETTSVAFGDEIAERTDEGTIITAPEYTLKSTIDGIVRLDFIFEDWASNTTTKSWYVIKDTKINSSTVFNKKYAKYSGKEVKGDDGKTVIYKTVSDESIVTNLFDTNGSITETLDFTTCRDKFYTDNFVSIAKENKIKYNIIWGYKRNELNNYVNSTSSPGVYTFSRDTDKDCYLRITCFDEAGNSEQILRAIPRKISVINTKKEINNNGEPIYKMGVYDIDDLLNNNVGNFEYNCVYTYQADKDSEISEMRVMGYDMTTIGYGGHWIEDYFKNSFFPAGLYRIYLLPYFYYDERVSYYGAVSSTPYILYHNCEPEQSQTNPYLPSSFSVELDVAVTSAGCRTGCVILPDSFYENKSDGFEYGVKIVNGTTERYAGLYFTVDSGYNYTVYVYATDSVNPIKVSEYYENIDATEDNIPPYIEDVNSYTLFDVSTPNNLCLRQFRGWIPKDDGAGMKKDSEGLSVFNYYLTKKDGKNTEIDSFICNTSEKQIAQYKSNSTQIDLNWSSFVESYYYLTLELTDARDNTSIYNMVVSNIVKPSFPTVTLQETGSNFIVKTLDSCNNYGMSFDILTNNQWLRNRASLCNISMPQGRCQQTYNITSTTKFVRFFVHNDGPTVFFHSLLLFICPEYLIKKRNGQNPVCNSKSIIPAINNSYQVFYDAPCFAHTMAFPTNMLEDLETKTQEALELDNTLDYGTAYIAVWETKGREYNLKLLNDQWAPGTATYKVPVNEIEKDFSYITIFHFADGSTEATEIYQKK